MQKFLRWKALGMALAYILIFGGVGAVPSRADVGVRPLLPGGSSLKPEDENSDPDAGGTGGDERAPGDGGG